MIEARGLTKNFPTPAGRVQALRGVDLSLGEGDSVGLVGESGSGKSTLGRALLWLVPPDAGSVRFAGQSLADLAPGALRRFRRQMQVVFQDPATSLNPRLSIGSALREARQVHDLPQTDLLPLVGLPSHYASRYPHELSGGERQRVAIARALAVEPRFLVADEPVASLDHKTARQILELLAELRHTRGLTTLLVTHDLTTAARTSSRVAVMYSGRIVEEGATETLLDTPLHPYTRALVAAAPRRDRTTLEPLEGEPPSPLAPPSGCAFHPRCPLAVALCRIEAPELRETAGRRVACHVAR